MWPHGPSLKGARFTPKGGADALYLAGDPTLALLEVDAIYNVPHGPPVAIPANPKALFQVKVALSAVLDVADAGTQTALSTTVQELTGDWRYSSGTGQPTPTHVLGELAYASKRIEAILSLSAKDVAGRVLVVFPGRLSKASFVEVFDGTGTLKQRLP